MIVHFCGAYDMHVNCQVLVFCFDSLTLQCMSVCVCKCARMESETVCNCYCHEIHIASITFARIQRQQQHQLTSFIFAHLICVLWLFRLRIIWIFNLWLRAQRWNATDRIKEQQPQQLHSEHIWLELLYFRWLREWQRHTDCINDRAFCSIA